MSQSTVNLNAVMNKFLSSSPESCAYKCLTDTSSTTGIDGYKCLSFDVCLNPQPTPGTSSFICSFYDRSFVTDPSVIIATEPSCDHYSSLNTSIKNERIAIS